MNSWLRYFFLFIVVVFLQVTIGNSIHLLGVAIPFLYIYFIIICFSQIITLPLPFRHFFPLRLRPTYPFIGILRLCLFTNLSVRSL